MHSPVFLLLLQVALIVALSRLMGLVFARLRQPQVIGEMIAGIMLGPSVLGAAWPRGQAWLFPPDSVGLLNTLSQFGVVFFLFLIGLELDPKLVTSRGRSAIAVSGASIALPFALGAATGAWLIRLGVFGNAAGVNPLASSLFMGAAMSITAFPVLARILAERNLHATDVGAVAIACAAMNDVAAWVILAFVSAVASAAGAASAVRTAALAAAYVAAMVLLVRPFLGRLRNVYDRQDRLPHGVLAVIFLLVLLSAFAAEAIGVHAMFGAFVAGFVMPKAGSFVRSLTEKLEDFTVVLLLPIFFAYAGLRTKLSLLGDDPRLWACAAVVIAVACAGKFGGTALAARAAGTPWRESATLGVLMNARGLVELVILTVGLQLGVINDTVFAIMVLMALVTTFMTTPLLFWVYPHSKRLRAGGAAPARRGFNVLIPVADPRSGGPLVQLAHAIRGRGEEREPGAEPVEAGGAIYALHLSRPTAVDAYRSAAGEPAAAPASDPTLRILMDHAQRHQIAVEPISFSSRDVAADVARVAREREADLVLIGFHKPVFGKTILGGVVHRVLTGVDADVGVFVDRGFLGARRVLVPFVGDSHDRLAIRLAHRLVKNADAEVTVLHVVPPAATEVGAKREEVLREFAEPAGAESNTPIQFSVVQDASPVDAVLREAGKGYDLVIIGVSEEWGLESHLFGFRPERIAERVDCSLLIVRKHKLAPVTSTASSAPQASATPTPTTVSPVVARPG